MYRFSKNKKFITSIFCLFTFAILNVAIVSCKPNSPDWQENRKDISTTSVVTDPVTIPDSVVQFLIVSAAKDFNDYQHPAPIDFRNVKAGYLPGEPRNFLICGEFITNGNSEEWKTFATIKTSGYEQYIGNTSLSYCNNSKPVIMHEADLSATLKNKLAELKRINDQK